MFLSTRPSSLVRRFAVVGILAATTVAVIAACDDENPTAPVAPGFLGGTATNHEIAVVLNSLGKSLNLFQLGSPTTTLAVGLGTSSTVTPTGFSMRKRLAAVPLGDAASVALVNLETATVDKYFLFASGNATGSAFADDTTIIATNLFLNVAGRFTVGQTGNTITNTVSVAPQPTAVVVSGTRAFVISSNLDQNFSPIGPGVVTAIDTRTMQVIGTVFSGGNNSTDAAIGPDGMLYVINTLDFVASGSLTIINPNTLQVITTIQGVGSGPGAISIDASGLAYISGFFLGTVVWNTKTRLFVKGPDHPLCAPLSGGGCRGAFAASVNANGDVYQAFFGSASQGLAPYVFVYRFGTYALTDSIPAGASPTAIAVRTF